MIPANELDRIVAAPGGDPALRCLALAFACACVGRFDEGEALARRARRHGVSDAWLREAGLQVASYAGFPRAIEFLGRLAGWCPPHGDDAGTPDEGDRARRGRAAFRAVYGEGSEEVLASLEALVPGFSLWVIEDAYGRALARPALPVRERELLAVAALALMGLPTPLSGHVRGALRNGSTRDDVGDILRCSRPLGDDRSQSVIDAALDRLSRKVDCR